METQNTGGVESGPIVNILTNYDSALEAIGEIEGDWWKRNQSVDSGYSLTSALKNLQRERANRSAEEANLLDFIVYGNGGTHRYIIRGDGSVWFHKGFVDGSLGKKRREELFRKVQELKIGLFGG